MQFILIAIIIQYYLVYTCAAHGQLNEGSELRGSKVFFVHGFILGGSKAFFVHDFILGGSKVFFVHDFILYPFPSYCTHGP